MKTDVYDSIRFHALHKRRLPTPTPARWVLGAAAAAIVLAAYAGATHVADDAMPKTGTQYEADDR